MSMLDNYLHAAMQRAQYQIADDESIVATIAEFENVSACGETLEACQQELMEALEERVFFHLARGLPLPTIAGIAGPRPRIY
ncbi:MAG: type II toxin-antitoxin system HicB family antitoxin [Cyanobacteria bacterium P01_F01_bin.42]